MLIFLIVGGLFKLLESQLLYQSSLVKNTILHDGMLSEQHILLENCDKLLQDEREKSIEMARNVNKLTKKLEMSDLALMTLQPLINLTDSDMVEICKKHPSLVLAHPRKCQQYYNCSMKEDENLSYKYRVRRLYLTECDYPDLFSIETLKCENFTDVKCGSRYEVKWKCGYDRYTLRPVYDSPKAQSYSHSCEDDNPFCIGYPDGIYENENARKGNFGYYKKCYKDRVIEVGNCPDNSFPYRGDCISAFEIPRFFHKFGLLPSCFGKNDGSYQYPNYPCEVYYTCNNGTAKGAKCPESQLFIALSGTCMGAVC
nr:uncharacterized protein LOC117682829 [Crassostrea gigas]